MNNSLTRFFGGSPARVLLQLVVFSFIVGIALTALGVSPFDIVNSFIRLLQRIYDSGFETLAWAWRYFLLGAIIVFPVWLVMRLLRFGRRPPTGL
jgi:Na+/H+-dicarboxylate symporter